VRALFFYEMGATVKTVRFAILIQIIIDLGMAQGPAATITGHAIRFHINRFMRRKGVGIAISLRFWCHFYAPALPFARYVHTYAAYAPRQRANKGKPH
jgi:hypothetical protein